MRGNDDMAWIALAKQLSGGNAIRYDVRRVIGGTVSRVDFGPNIAATSLAYSDGTIFWLNGGTANSAGLP